MIDVSTPFSSVISTPLTATNSPNVLRIPSA
jgi:hypothetical protein